MITKTRLNVAGLVVSAFVLAAATASAAPSCETADLLHRWSFNGSLADACGGNTAKIDGGVKWNDADHPTSLVLPGGAFGAGAVDLGYDCGVPGGEFTLEIWAQQNQACSWSRVFDWGWNSGNFMALCWTRGTDLATDSAILTGGGSSYCSVNNTLQPYALGVQYHISVRLTQRANGGVDMKWQKRDASTGALLAGDAFGMDSEWSLARLNEWQFCLGRAHNSQTDNDPAATYDEVRIWKKTLTDEQLAWSARLGPDTLPTDAGNASVSTVFASVAGSGTVAFNGGEAAATASVTAARSGSATLVATPANGWLFHRWSGDTCRITGGTETDATITIDTARDAALVAEFVGAAEPMTAVWTGAAGNGNLSDAANWQCRSLDGNLVSGAIPTAYTAITIEGETDFNCPVGSSLQYASLVVGDCRLKGDCDWRGLGAFTIDGKVDVDGHTLRVARLDGTGIISSPFAVDTTAVAPAIVANNASFWLDAADSSTLTYNDRGEVLTWTSKDANHVVATSQGSDLPPVDGTALWGRPTVDFGEFSSKRDLVYSRFTKLRTVFWVIRLATSGSNTYNFLLGDKFGGKGAYNFHRGANGKYGATQWAKFSEVWNGTEVVNWGADVVPDHDFQIVTATMQVDSSSDSISYDRANPTSSGGRQLSELICFNTVLSATDRTNVVQYLERKWRGATGAPGTLVLDVPAEATASVAVDIGGNLKLVKTGSGAYRAEKKQYYFGDTDLADGTMVTELEGKYGMIGAYHSGTFTVGANTVFDINGHKGMMDFPIVFDGGTVVNSGGLACDATGAFVDITLSDDSRLDCTQHGFGLWHSFVDLGGHTLEVKTGNTTDGFFSYYNTANATFPNQILTNGTLRVHGEGELKIWENLDVRTVDFDLDCPLWMCWTTTVHNLTYRYTRQDNELENIEFGEFRVTGTFNPVSSAFVRTEMLNGSTLDLSGQTGVWSTLGTRQGKAHWGVPLGECLFEPNGTVTIDVHGRTFATGERVITWTKPPQNVTFQWDAATAAANPGVAPLVAADGLFFGFDAAVVASARWTGAANDGDLANPANWNCANPNGDAVANALPGANAVVHLSGEHALDIPAGTTFACAAVEVEDLKLTGDCDWRGFSGVLMVKNSIDLQGHRLWLATPPRGTGGQIVSSYGFDSDLATPSLVASEACFWLDAADPSTLTVGADGRVTAWRSKGTVEVSAVATNAVMSPAWSPYANGRPCVDFGATGSKQDLSYPRFTKLRTVFWVVKISKSGLNSSLLGDSEAYHFHRGENSQYGDSRWAQFATVWNGTEVVDWGNDVIPDDDFQIISATMGVDGWSDSLTTDRKSTTRNGGRQLSELIAFERTLSDAERTEVTRYLQQKWGRRHGANGMGELHLTVPADENFVNRETLFSGQVKFVKEGAGTFTAGYRGQSYLGGTEAVEGILSTLRSPDSSLTLYRGSDGRCFGTGTDIVVGAGSTLDIKGNHDYHVWTIQLEGGTLRNSGRDMRSDWGGIGDVDVTADSRFVCDFQTVVYNGGMSSFGLNGHQLTVELNAPLWMRQTMVTNGTLRLVGDGALVVATASNWRTADLMVEAPLELYASLDVRNYTAAYTGDANAGAGVVNVYGNFCPVTDNFAGCLLQNGATLDLSGRTGTFSDGNGTMGFAPGAAIVVDIHGRTPAVGEKLVAWTVPPVEVTFTWDSASAANAAPAPVVRSDGLYYGGEEDQVVTDAVWTGQAGDGDIAKPTNWTCRNVAGRVVEGGLPGPLAVVHLSGTVKVDFPIGNAFAYRELDFGDIKLAADCDWRGLKPPAGLHVDLDGHKLYLSELPASGTATCALFDEGDNVGEEPAILSEACLWLDAAYTSSLVLSADNQVQRWTSRDPVHHVAYPYGNAPTYNTTLWGGRPTIDFGALGSQQDLQFDRLTKLRTVFEVTKMQNSEKVFFLADSGSAYNFHRGDKGQYASTKWANVATAWNGTTAVNPGTDVLPSDSFQFVSLTMSVDSTANRLSKDRTFNDRTGGKQLSELICFERTLSDAERVTVTEYLQNKWLRGYGHRGELHLDVPAGKTLVNTGFMMEQSVRFVKDGEGSYVANCVNQSYLGGNEVTGGAVRPAQVGTKHVFGGDAGEMVLREGTVFESYGQNEYTTLKFILDGGTIRNTGADLKDNTALGKITLTADSRLEPLRSLSVWWDQHYLELGGHTLTVQVGIGRYFSLGVDTTTVRNGTLDITSGGGGGWFRVYHGALDASTVSLRTLCAIEIDDAAGPLTVKDYTALYQYDYNKGTNIVKVVSTFKPAAGQYFRGCELANGATLDLSEQTDTLSVKSAFTSGANEMTFASDATTIQVILGDQPVPASGKVVDWTGRPPANLSTMKFSLDAASRRRGRRLIAEADGLYVISGCVLFFR